MRIHRKSSAATAVVVATTSALGLLASNEARATGWVFDGTSGTNGVSSSGGPGQTFNDGRTSGYGTLYTGSSSISVGTNSSGEFANGRYVDGDASSDHSSGGFPSSAGGGFDNYRDITFYFVRSQGGSGNCVVDIKRTATVGVSALEANGQSKVYVSASNVSSVMFVKDWSTPGGPVDPGNLDNVNVPQTDSTHAKLTLTFGVLANGNRSTSNGSWSVLSTGRVTVMPPE